MSEVKRFRADQRHVVETEFDDAQFVRVADYDASQAELARLRAELASHDSVSLLMNAWVAEHKTQMPWDKAIEMIAVVTKMDNSEKQRLLCLDDPYELLHKRNAELETALTFYADRDHYSTDDGLNWDSCSGEPSNILWHEEQPWFIEDGSVARAVLEKAKESAK